MEPQLTHTLRSPQWEGWEEVSAHNTQGQSQRATSSTQPHTTVLEHSWLGYSAGLVTQPFIWYAKDEAFPVQSLMEEHQALPYSVQGQMAPLHSRKVMHFTTEILQTEGSKTVVDSPVRTINTVNVECKLFLRQKALS